MSTFPHLNEQGDAHMVDVTAKTVTQRSATARSRVSLSPEVVERLNAGDMPKGDALAVARIAAISATKKTSDLNPLCHPLAIHGVDVSVELDETGSHITVTVKTADRTGVEMEALSAVSVGLLTIYDMCKAVDRGMTISGIQLLEKQGGKSGHWQSTKAI